MNVYFTLKKSRRKFTKINKYLKTLYLYYFKKGIEKQLTAD